jgi:beta-galactosidase
MLRSLIGRGITGGGITGGGREYLVSPLRPNFWRAPLDNDMGWKTPEKMGAWKEAGEKAELQKLEPRRDGAETRLTGNFHLPVEATGMQITYALYPDGSLQVSLQLELGKASPELPRIGFQFAVPSAFDHIQWYGRGPQENYWDRKTGAPVGIYSSDVDSWITPYVRPQENANRTDIRWASLTGTDGRGLHILAGQRLLGISAWPYSENDLETATHYFQLPHRDFITVNIDGWQMGVGGDISWGLPVHDKYRMLTKGTYRYSFYLKPM